MKSVAPIVAPVVALAAVLFALPAQAQRTLDIRARTAGDLADLCGANPRDPQGDAKINYCHGFAQGAVDAMTVGLVVRRWLVQGLTLGAVK